MKQPSPPLRVYPEDEVDSPRYLALSVVWPFDMVAAFKASGILKLPFDLIRVFAFHVWAPASTKSNPCDGNPVSETTKLILLWIHGKSVLLENPTDESRNTTVSKVIGTRDRKVVNKPSVNKARFVASSANSSIDGGKHLVRKDGACDQSERKVVFVGAESCAKACHIRHTLESVEEQPIDASVMDARVEVGDVCFENKDGLRVWGEIGFDVSAAHSSMAVRRYR